MKNPFDDKPGTVVIKKDEVTEQWKADELLARQKKPVARPPASTATATRKAPSVPTATKEEITQAIDEVLGNLNKQKVDEFSSSLKATELGGPKAGNLGEILMNMTRLTQEQLDEAIQAQKAVEGESEFLGDILVKKHLITEDELLHALSLQTNIPIAKDLASQEIDPDLVTKVPINFAKKHGVVPLRKERNSIIVAISNAIDLSPVDDLRILLKSHVKPVLARKSAVIDMINRVYDRASKAHDELMEDLGDSEIGSMDLVETQDLLDSEDEAPIIRLVNSLLFRAVKERASDIHIEPFEKEISVRFRIDGVLYEIMKPPKRVQNSISSRVKIMAQLDIAERRIPQDGRIKIRIAGRDVDIRVSTLPTSHGERIVMRLLDTSSVLLDLKDIGFNKKQLEMIAQVIHKSNGIFLVTGPTGSGKTTTLYSCLSRINSRERNIITVEDPVEIQLHGIGQIQVNTKVDLTFANGLRSILRQDPDVIMVGEIRDKETAEIAIQASLTGHLVFSTLHTNDAASSITRLVDMGVEAYLVSSSLIAILAQRLVRVVCTECRRPYTPDDGELREIGIDPLEAKKRVIYRAQGCSICSNTGYLGRTGIYELMPVDDELRGLISKSADATTLKKAALSRGMKSLRDDGAYKVLEGMTTIDEVLRVTQEDMEFS